MANKKRSTNNAGKLSAAKEQRRIERMLGEEFSSLRAARAALKRESAVVTERTYERNKQAEKEQKKLREASDKALRTSTQASTQATRKGTSVERGVVPVHSVRELSGRVKKGFKQALTDHAYAKKLDATLKPGEHVIAEVRIRYRNKQGKIVERYMKTHDSYTSYSALFLNLMRYVKRNEKNEVSDRSIARWMSATKILTTTQTGAAYKAVKDKEIAQHAKEKFVKKDATKKGKGKKATS